MEQLMQTIRRINAAVSGVVWGPPMLLLLMGTGLYLTVRTGFLPLTRFPLILRETAGSLLRREKRGPAGPSRNLTPFEAVSTALASTVGTGSVAGVTGAILIGGPGAVFWMWCSALLGMCTKFSEVTLALHFRERSAGGNWTGGPMYYIKNGLGKPWQWLAAL